MRYLGLDYGTKTCGASISDSTGLIAISLEVIRYNSSEELFSKLKKIIEEKKISKIVLGNPLNLNGTLSKRSEETIKFKELLEKEFNIEVFMQDERLSTIEAERILLTNNTKRKDRKKVIDKMAAVIILQTYLDKRQ